MAMVFLPFILTIMLLMAAPVCGAAEVGSVFGLWMTEGGASKLEILPCGENKACAKIIWLKNPNYVNSKDGPVGTEKTDRQNPDISLRNRPIMGLQVMDGLTLDGEWWKNGTCYDPQTGKTYQCKMQLESPLELKLRGFIGFSLLGRSYTLTRDQSDSTKTVLNRPIKNGFP
jgi:uncharacterized protein (DUF2147 family)